jgi:hypothetical protein
MNFIRVVEGFFYSPGACAPGRRLSSIRRSPPPRGGFVQPERCSAGQLDGAGNLVRLLQPTGRFRRRSLSLVVRYSNNNFHRPTNIMTTSHVIAQIGQKYSASFFTGGGFNKTSVTLSSDRIAGVGKTYTAASKGIVSFAAPLKDVSSVGLEYSSNYILLILGILLLAAYGLGIILIIAYFFSKQRYIVINIQGFAYALSLRGISNKEVDGFIETTIQTLNSAK